MERLGKLYGKINHLESLIYSGYAEDPQELRAEIREIEREIDRVGLEIEKSYEEDED